jgi:hypothetical protein
MTLSELRDRVTNGIDTALSSLMSRAFLSATDRQVLRAMRDVAMHDDDWLEKVRVRLNAMGEETDAPGRVGGGGTPPAPPGDREPDGGT